MLWAPPFVSRPLALWSECGAHLGTGRSTTSVVPVAGGTDGGCVSQSAQGLPRRPAWKNARPRVRNQNRIPWYRKKGRNLILTCNALKGVCFVQEPIMVASESSPVIVRETVEWKIKLHRSRLGGVGHRRA